MQLQHLPEIYDLINGRDLFTAGPGLTVAEAARLMAENAIGAVIVCDGDGGVAGVFTERDVLNRVVAEGRDPATTPLGAVMTANPETLPLDHSVQDALNRMIDAGFRHMPVVEKSEEDGHEVLVGVISARDVLRVFRDKLSMAANSALA